VKRNRYGITALIIGIITLVIMPIVLRAQIGKPDSSAHDEVRTFTAPQPGHSKPKKIEQPKALAVDEELALRISAIEPRVDIIQMPSGNQDHMPAGFYATYSPKAYDTVFIYEGATDEFKVIGVEPGKEVIQAPDSLAVAQEVTFRMSRFNGDDIPITQEKKITSRAMIIRSGFIPAQGFGTMRYRFAVKPGAFMLTGSSMITASVHLLAKDNIGTILCTVTNIDQKKGIFYLETANEVPKGETINWIVVNTP
jgi:hypothetical protein